jgi:uncharacterized 2Fe-2S/4Fe-4S cluster protein (DUF4445 family)
MVRIDEGGEALSPPTEAEGRFTCRPGFRLACQTKIVREDLDIRVEVPRYAKYQVLVRGRRADVPLEPLVRHIPEPPKPGVYLGGRYLGDYEGELYGLALDIGTTTLSVYWVDLERGVERYVASMLNPQVRYGDNVIDRVAYARAWGQEYLERTIREAVNELVDSGPVAPEHIYQLVAVGNTVMRDLFIGHSVAPLGTAPYEPVSTGPVSLDARRLGLNINPQAEVYALPLLGHFVGADALAVILATRMHLREEITMAIDIGTNTEIMLGNRDRILVASCASGPAFEGAGIKWGTGAVEGAIQRIHIEPDGRVVYKTIGNKPPVGICGSGLIDALASLLERGIINWRGRFTDGSSRFVVARNSEDIFLDGEDIDNLKLAKAAIAVGTQVLMKHYGVKPQDIAKLFLAGAFGTYIDPANARKIGMLPEIPLKRVVKVGNAAIEGARQVLISRRKREEAEGIPRLVRHIRLELEEDFHDRFVGELAFTRYQPAGGALRQA